jgi:hypothetical protein
MKNILLLFFLFLIKFSIAQKNKDNIIKVYGFVDFNKLKTILFDKGFMPTNSDTSFILTNYKQMGWRGEVGFMIKRTDTVTIFKGLVLAEFEGSTPIKDQLENKGEKVSVYRKGFAKMSEIANSFNLPVTYHRLKE